jgi:hypothetical protein
MKEESHVKLEAAMNGHTGGGPDAAFSAVVDSLKRPIVLKACS